MNSNLVQGAGPLKTACRIAWLLWGILCLPPNIMGQENPVEADLDKSAALLEHYCVDCHATVDSQAGFEINVRALGSRELDPETWETVIRKLRHRQMPPVDADRPSEETYDFIVESLEQHLDGIAEASPNAGRTSTFRRLTRTEYQNAIRDLLSVDIDAQSMLPKDELSFGFDNITVAELSPTLLERYVVAAKEISGRALGRATAPVTETFTVPLDLTQEQHQEGLPFGTRGGGAFQYNFPQEGDYDFQLRLTRDRDGRVEGIQSREQRVILMIDGVPRKEFTVGPYRRGQDHTTLDNHLSARLPLSPGPHQIVATFAATTSAQTESQRAPALASFNRDRHPRLQPAIYSLAINGPHASNGPGDTPSRNKIFTCYPQQVSEELDCGRQIIEGLMRRAFRQPVAASQLEIPMRLFDDARADQGFEAGIATAVRAILVSPHFLFRIERDPAESQSGTCYEISQLELASRMSFFLWSSIPDEALLDAAERRRLNDPDELREQVRRMLADPRAVALADNFGSQWLHLPNLASVTPDARLFMDFDHNLREAMQRETQLLLRDVVMNDRSLLELLRTDYTYVNERLARHYGIPHVYGSHFRRIDLPADSHRGGILGHASILTVTSYANRTSPILRGKWILDNILGMPPKPPPPDVPQLKEKSESGELESLRERVAAHRENPQCAGCHNYLDPLGFALEEFDAIGRWRDNDEGQPIDASGNLADGAEFDGALELQHALSQRPEWFVQTVCEKMLIYALGRGLQAYDAPAVRKIVKQAARDDYRFSAVVQGIVTSTPFRMRNVK